MSVARAFGVGLLVLGLACGITSTALDYWFYYSNTVLGHTDTAYFGLWEACAKTALTSRCVSWSYLADHSEVVDIAWLHACQAMMIIGAILNAAACGAAIYATMKQMPTRITQVVAVVAGIFYLIAAAIFGVKYENSVSDEQNGGHLHAGFGLAIVAGLVNLISICVLSPAHTQIRDGYVQV